ncbi:MAG: hypothetical protein R3C16_02620 [Hyphomonadaceae bacterium]
MDPLAIIALAVGIGLFVLIAVVSMRRARRPRSRIGGDQGAIIPVGFADDGGADGGGDGG